MITTEQIRAARALLNWTQLDLARESQISLSSINNIERAIGSPRTDTMRVIELTLIQAGIEFIGKDGVKKHSEAFDLQEFQGDDYIKHWMDDFTSCMLNAEDTLMVCGLDERKFPQYAPEEMLRYEAHHKLTGFKEHILIKEGDDFLTTNPSCYRWISSALLGTIPYLVYKNRFVIVMYEAKRIIVIRNQSIAESFRKQFEFLWDQAKTLPQGLSNKMDDLTYREALEKSIQKK